MRLEVELKKEGSFWLIEAPALDVMTQGKTKKEACAMLADAIKLLVNKKGFKASVKAAPQGREFYLCSTDNDSLIALLLRRQRQKHGLTLKELAERLGSTSVNSFARYEQGKASPSLAKLLELMTAIDPKLAPVLRLST